MNIFAVNESPFIAATELPDKHIVKMPLESAQMVSIIYSNWYYGWGDIYKADGTPYETKRGAFRNHPCTIWASKSYENLAWLITHGIHLCTEYYNRYGKIHSCNKTLFDAKKIFHKKTSKAITIYSSASEFVRAMPDDLKYDNTISTIEAYQRYVASKPWVKDNYLRKPERMPEWILNYA